MEKLNSPISSLRGIGQARAEAFSRLGIRKVGDLLWHYPRSYENRGAVRTLAEAVPGEKQAFLLTVATAPSAARLRRGMTLLKFRAIDTTGSCEIIYFNQDYLKTAFTVGEEYRFYGKVEKKGQKLTLSSPSYEPYRENVTLPPLFPIYPSRDGLSQKLIKAGVAEALSAATTELSDYLPNDIRMTEHLPTLLSALRGMHTPGSYDELVAAKRRLTFDELFLFALSLRTAGHAERERGAPPCKKNDLAPFLSLLPYSLTGAQKKAVDAIRSDMSADISMNRLLIGDVGCGKTVCAAAALYVAVQNGLQGALMAPTEILARQHYAELAPLFERLGIRTALLIGALTAKQKKTAHAAIASHEADIVIGTQALLSDNVDFARLGLAVIDEQHRFGVGQRALLSGKGEKIHTLFMSATPIPRTLALTIYGGLDMTKIDELPPGRQVVDTFFVGEGYRERLNGFIRKQVSLGGRVYIVCPAVEERDEEEGDLLLSDIGTEREALPPMKSAVEYTAELKAALSGLRIAYVHGKLKSAEKDEVMNAFAAGDLDVLVSTTVIEVGVNVPEATLMIVENADRFGLSQLHQLRGRVGRGKQKAYCVLVSDTKGETARERLRTMCRTHDGFVIAETDLKLRGPGDFLKGTIGNAIRQSGGTDFALADLSGDTDMLERAFSHADRLLAEDGLANNASLAEKLSSISAENESKLN